MPDSPDTIDLLNRVLVLLQRSFPQYLRYARPYIPLGREGVMKSVEEIADCQDALAERIGQHVFESGGLPDPGKFPIEFADTHDLDISFLLREAVDYQQDDVAQLSDLVEKLRSSPAAQALASEALGTAKGHLDLLKQLQSGEPASTTFSATPAFANDMPVSGQASSTPHR